MTQDDVCGYSAIVCFGVMAYALTAHDWLAAVAGFLGFVAGTVGIRDEK